MQKEELIRADIEARARLRATCQKLRSDIIETLEMIRRINNRLILMIEAHEATEQELRK